MMSGPLDCIHVLPRWCRHPSSRVWTHLGVRFVLLDFEARRAPAILGSLTLRSDFAPFVRLDARRKLERGGEGRGGHDVSRLRRQGTPDGDRRGQRVGGGQSGRVKACQTGSERGPRGKQGRTMSWLGREKMDGDIPGFVVVRGRDGGQSGESGASARLQGDVSGLSHQPPFRRFPLSAWKFNMMSSSLLHILCLASSVVAQR